MKLTKLNDWLTLAANIGVIAGIVFLAMEINQSNKVTIAATYQARISEIENSYQNTALSDFLPAIYEKIDKEGLDSITSIELRRVRDWETARVYRMQGQFYQYQQGYLDEGSYQDLLRGGRDFMPMWIAVGADISALDPEFLAIIRE